MIMNNWRAPATGATEARWGPIASLIAGSSFRQNHQMKSEFRWHRVGESQCHTATLPQCHSSVMLCFYSNTSGLAVIFVWQTLLYVRAYAQCGQKWNYLPKDHWNSIVRPIQFDAFSTFYLCILRNACRFLSTFIHLIELNSSWIIERCHWHSLAGFSGL